MPDFLTGKLIARFIGVLAIDLILSGDNAVHGIEPFIGIGAAAAFVLFALWRVRRSQDPTTG